MLGSTGLAQHGPNVGNILGITTQCNVKMLGNTAFQIWELAQHNPNIGLLLEQFAQYIPNAGNLLGITIPIATPHSIFTLLNIHHVPIYTCR